MHWLHAATTQVAMHECDICFISYEALRKELRNGADALLTRYGFWRLMLDEAQNVASSNSAAAAAASSIWRFQVGPAGLAADMWCTLTGTRLHCSVCSSCSPHAA